MFRFFLAVVPFTLKEVLLSVWLCLSPYVSPPWCSRISHSCCGEVYLINLLYADVLYRNALACAEWSWQSCRYDGVCVCEGKIPPVKIYLFPTVLHHLSGTITMSQRTPLCSETVITQLLSPLLPYSSMQRLWHALQFRLYSQSLALKYCTPFHGKIKMSVSCWSSTSPWKLVRLHFVVGLKLSNLETSPFVGPVYMFVFWVCYCVAFLMWLYSQDSKTYATVSVPTCLFHKFWGTQCVQYSNHSEVHRKSQRKVSVHFPELMSGHKKKVWVFVHFPLIKNISFS